MPGERIRPQALPPHPKRCEKPSYEFWNGFRNGFFLVVFLGRNRHKTSIRKSIRPATPLFIQSSWAPFLDFHPVSMTLGPPASVRATAGHPASEQTCTDSRGNKQSPIQTGKQESNKKPVGKPKSPLPQAHSSQRKLWAHENVMDFAGCRFSCLGMTLLFLLASHTHISRNQVTSPS